MLDGAISLGRSVHPPKGFRSAAILPCQTGIGELMIWIFNMPYRMALLVGLLILFPGMMLWIWFVNVPILDRLEREGQRTVAHVTFVSAPYDRVRATRGGGQRDIHYQFSAADGTQVEGVITEYQHVRRVTQVGDTFGITYWPRLPQVHDTDRGGRYGGTEMLIPLAVLWLVIVGLMIHEWRNRPDPWEGPKLWPPVRFT